MSKELFETYGAIGKWKCNRNDLKGKNAVCKAYITYGEYKCELCIRGELDYSFTAEKVLELEEMILTKYEVLELSFSIDTVDEYLYYVEKDYCDCAEAAGKTRTEALSSLLIKLHDHFTEEERTSVKEILGR